MGYKPRMNVEEAGKREAWQQRTYWKHADGPKSRRLRFHGLQLTVPFEVFVPVPWEVNLLAQSIVKEVRENDRVLEIGTGSGVQSILAAKVAEEVVAVDVNPVAVKCATANARRNGVDGKMTVLRSDLFKNVQGMDKFSLIIFDPPFRWMKPRDLWEKSTADENYRAMTRFFRQAGKYLADDGRMLLHFGSSGDLAYFKRQIRRNGFRREQMMKLENPPWTYYTYMVTKKACKNEKRE